MSPSFITNITYTSASQNLIVSMEGRTYMYNGVTAGVAALFLVSPGWGEFFNKYIKNDYTYSQI